MEKRRGAAGECRQMWVMLSRFRERYIGDRTFYRMVLLLIVPMIVQQGVTNFVSLLDNVMVGALGTEQMSGVAIANQLFFVYNLSMFGGLSGAAIFGAQFFGQGDHEGMRHTMRFKLIFGMLMTVLAIAVFLLFGGNLVRLFLDNEANAGTDIGVTLDYARRYLRVMVWGLIPFMLVQVYAGTLRETSETVVPMIGSICAIFVNLSLNYVLIFGHFGFPKLGAVGAALATVISRYVEMLVVVLYTHAKRARFPFVRGLYRSLHVPAALVRKIIITGLPLLCNEMLWSVGTTFVNQNYSTRGLAVVAAMNIESTAWQLFCVIMFAMGNAVSILVGQKLGANEVEQAKDVDRKLLFFNLVLHIGIGLLIIACAPLVPRLYNTEPEVRELAMYFLMVAGASLPIHAFIHTAYFTIRSGGKTIVTFFFDSVYTWCVPVVLSFLLCRYTALPIVTVFLIVQFSDVIKLFIAVPMLHSGFWAKNLVGGKRGE